MSWQAVAKKDVKDSIRSRTLWALIALFLGIVFLVSFLVVDGGEESLEAAAGFSFLIGIIFFVPLAGLVISIKSVIRERESGTINLLLSLPHSRKDMVIGKFVGRSIVITVAVLAGFLPALLYTLIQIDGFPMFEMVTFLMATSLFGMMFVGIGLGFSALVNSETQATFGSVLILFLLFLWPFIMSELGLSPPDFLMRFWLFIVFIELWFTLLAINEADLSFTDPSLVEFDSMFEAELEGATFSADPHMQMWFVFVILAIWIVVPITIGYFRFKNQDL